MKNKSNYLIIFKGVAIVCLIIMFFFIHVNNNLEKTNGMFMRFEKKNYIESSRFKNMRKLIIWTKLKYIVNEKEYFIKITKGYFELKKINNTIPIYYYRYFPALGSISNYNFKIIILFIFFTLFGFLGWKKNISNFIKKKQK